MKRAARTVITRRADKERGECGGSRSEIEIEIDARGECIIAPIAFLGLFICLSIRGFPALEAHESENTLARPFPWPVHIFSVLDLKISTQTSFRIAASSSTRQENVKIN